MSVWKTEEYYFTAGKRFIKAERKIVKKERWKNMKVKDVMHTPTFVDPDKPIVDAVKKMEKMNISSVIVGSAENPVGMFTERDVLREVVMKGVDAQKVSLNNLLCGTELKDVMCRVLTTVNENSTIEAAAEKMMGRYVRHMPVTDDGNRIVGMVSARTVMNALKYSYFTRRNK